MNQLDLYVADAVLGIDTLWGGDVMCPSGTGRFIADSWFSDEPLPAAYTHPAAARVREIGRRWRQRLSTATLSRPICATSIFPRPSPACATKPPVALNCAAPILRASLSRLDVMWDLAMEVLGKGDPVPYTRAVEASTGKPPEPSQPEAKARARGRAAGPRRLFPSQSGGILAAVDAWRRERVTPMASVKALGAAVIAHFDALSAKNLIPYLPQELAQVPRANIDFCPSRTPGSPAR